MLNVKWVQKLRNKCPKELCGIMKYLQLSRVTATRRAQLVCPINDLIFDGYELINEPMCNVMLSKQNLQYFWILSL